MQLHNRDEKVIFLVFGIWFIIVLAIVLHSLVSAKQISIRVYNSLRFVNMFLGAGLFFIREDQLRLRQFVLGKELSGIPDSYVILITSCFIGIILGVWNRHLKRRGMWNNNTDK